MSGYLVTQLIRYFNDDFGPFYYDNADLYEAVK